MERNFISKPVVSLLVTSSSLLINPSMRASTPEKTTQAQVVQSEAVHVAAAPTPLDVLHLSKDEFAKMRFDNLVQMQQASVALHKNDKLFATKDATGAYQWMTYEQFGRQVDQMRSAMHHKLGVEKGTKIAVIADNCAEWAVIAYAAMGLGAVIVPMYTVQPAELMSYKIKHSEAQTVFVANSKIFDLIKDKSDLHDVAHYINMSPEKTKDGALDFSFAELLAEGAKKEVPVTHIENDDQMTLVYTSGTTDTPKAVPLTHGNVAAIVNRIPEIVDIKGERSLSFLPWAHVFGQVVELHALLRLGNSAAFAESSKTIMPDMKLAQPTLFFTVPKMLSAVYSTTLSKLWWPHQKYAFKKWRKIRDKQRLNQTYGGWSKFWGESAGSKITKKVQAAFGGQVKFVFSGGAHLDEKVALFVEDVGIQVLEGYGLTETGGVISMNTPTARRLGSVGKPFPGIHIEFDHAPVKDWGPVQTKDGEAVLGEIVVYGPNIMQGYFGDDEAAKKATQESIVHHPEYGRGFRTGDAGYMQDGFLYLAGRIKDHFKLVDGKFVDPESYESVIKRDPRVKDAMLYGAGREHTVLLVNVSNKNLDLTSKKVVKEFEELMAATNKGVKERYAQPRKVVLVGEDWTPENGLLTSTLKMVRKKVADRYKDKLEAAYH